MTFRFRPWALLAGAAVLLALAACGGTTDNEPTNAGFVRLVNATDGTLDFYDGTTRIASASAHASTDYIDRLPESHDFKIMVGGTRDQVATLTTGVERQVRYSLVVGSSGNIYSTSLLTENEGTPSSDAKFRVYNAAPADLGSVDVYLRQSACTALSGPNASAVTAISAYTTVSAGVNYHVCVTGQGDPSDLRLDVPVSAFGNEQVVTLVLARGRGGKLADGLLVVQRGGVTPALNPSARVRLVADATAGLAASASVNGTSLGSGFTTPAIGGYVLVNAGPLDVSATIGGTTTSPVPAAAAQGGGDYTLLITGTAAAPVATLITDDNTPSTSSDKPVKLRLVNGLNGVTGSALFSYESTVVADSSASFATASAASQWPTTTGAPAITATFESTTLTVTTTGSLSAGKVYTLFLLGTPAAPVAKLQTDR
jgi:hypothetical protein